MPSATGFQLIVPPQIAAGEVTRVVAVLVGGGDLAATLTVNLLGDLVSATSGGSVPITIAPGAFAGSATFTVLGSPGSRAIAVTHSGGNSGMTGPASGSVQVVGGGFVPPASLRLTHIDVPTGTLPTWTARTGGPSGKGHVLGVEVVGNYSPSPLTLTFSDDAAGEFSEPTKQLDLSRNPPEHTFFIVYYFPRAAGLRTVTVAASGIPGTLATSSISFQANL